MIGRLAIAMLAGAAWPAAAQTDGAPDLARAFGSREAVEQVSLSPDGTKIAVVQPAGGQASVVMVTDLTTEGSTPVAVARTDGKPERMSGCRWVSNTRLMCTIYGIVRVGGDIAYSTRIAAVDANGGRIKAIPVPQGQSVVLSGGSVIDWAPGDEGSVLMVRYQADTTGTGTNIGTRKTGMKVDKVDSVSLRSVTVERPDATAREFITDGHGRVRIIGRVDSDNETGYDREGTRYFFRAASGDDWFPLSTVMSDRAGFDPYGVDRVLNVAFGLKRLDGRLAAYSVTLDGAMKETLLFAHPDVDVDGFARIGRRGRIVGVTYATDRRQVRYFDPALAKLAADLGKALGKTPQIRFVDSSEDEDRMLLWAGADDNAGRYYLFDRKARALRPLLDDRPALDGMTLAAMRAVSYPAADGTKIPGYLTLPPGRESAKGLPALVMPHGGPGARDEWGFDWLAQYFAMQGYAVLQPNFRGSTGYGDAWFQKNGFVGWKVAIGDVADAGRWLVGQGIADPKRLGIFGWSYGGYAALQAGVIDPDLFKAIVAVAPVTDLPRLREEWRGFSNFRTQRDFIGTGPHLVEGSPARNAERIKAPVLMFHGDLDRNVGVGQSRMMDAKLRDAGKASTLVVYDGLDHYLDDSTARSGMLTQASAFLSAAMPGK